MLGLPACNGRSSSADGLASVSFTSLGSYFFFLAIGLRAGGFDGCASSSGNYEILNPLLPIGFSSKKLGLAACSGRSSSADGFEVSGVSLSFTSFGS